MPTQTRTFGTLVHRDGSTQCTSLCTHTHTHTCEERHPAPSLLLRFQASSIHPYPSLASVVRPAHFLPFSLSLSLSLSLVLAVLWQKTKFAIGEERPVTNPFAPCAVKHKTAHRTGACVHCFNLVPFLPLFSPCHSFGSMMECMCVCVYLLTTSSRKRPNNVLVAMQRHEQAFECRLLLLLYLRQHRPTSMLQSFTHKPATGGGVLRSDAFEMSVRCRMRRSPGPRPTRPIKSLAPGQCIPVAGALVSVVLGSLVYIR